MKGRRKPWHCRTDLQEAARRANQTDNLCALFPPISPPWMSRGAKLVQRPGLPSRADPFHPGYMDRLPETRDSPEERQKQIFGLYVEQTFQRKGMTSLVFPRQKIIGLALVVGQGDERTFFPPGLDLPTQHIQRPLKEVGPLPPIFAPALSQAILSESLRRRARPI